LLTQVTLVDKLDSVALASNLKSSRRMKQRPGLAFLTLRGFHATVLIFSMNNGTTETGALAPTGSPSRSISASFPGGQVISP
jgi:hypothetical protein